MIIFFQTFFKKIVFIFFAAIALAGGFDYVCAAFNEQINYQGKLTDANDTAVADGNYNMRFKLCSASDCSGASDPLWTETRITANRVSVANGLFSILLGEVAALNSVDFNQTLYLEVSVGGIADTPSWETLTPRKKIGAVPAAFEAQKLGGYTWAAPGGIGSGTPGSAVFTTLSASATSTFSGNVGIATTSPGSALDVKGTLRLSGATSGYVGFAPAAAAGSTVYTLPSADGSNGQALITNSSGTLSWGSVGVSDHGALTGLTDDDHSIYALLAGRSGGQSFIGGTGTTDDLTLQTTSGVGEAGADMHFKVGNNGATNAMTILNSGNVGIGTANPAEKMNLAGGNFLHTASGNPTLEGAYDTNGDSYNVYVSGKYAYLADGTSGLQIIDVSNPASPSLAGTYNTSGYAYGVYVSGKYAYVADEVSGLQIIDVSNPASPSLVGTYDNGDYALGVYVSGKYAYVANAYSALEIIDVSNPASPSLAGAYNTSDYFFGVYVSGKYAYIGSDMIGLQIIDVSNPASPSLAGSFNTTGNATRNIYVSGKYAYVADGDSGLEIIDVSNPASPSLAGAYDTSFALGVYVSGKYAYVADFDAGLKIIDINGIETPSLYAGNINANDISITENADIANDLLVRGAGIFGRGLLVQNDLAVSATSTFSGNVGIGAASPAYQLELSTNSAAKPTSDHWTISSDARLKQDIVPIDNALETILKLQGREFEYINKDKYGSNRQYGFIAQEVEEVIPRWVRTGSDGYKNLTIAGDTALLVEAIKEQQKQINDINLRFEEAGLTGSTTVDALFASDSKESGFGFVEIIRSFLEKMGLVIKDGIASVKNLIADKITTKQICAKGDDGEEICLSKDQLKELLNKNGTSLTITKTIEFDQGGSQPPADQSDKTDEGAENQPLNLDQAGNSQKDDAGILQELPPAENINATSTELISSNN